MLFGAMDSWLERITGGQVRRPEPGEKELGMCVRAYHVYIYIYTCTHLHTYPVEYEYEYIPLYIFICILPIYIYATSYEQINKHVNIQASKYVYVCKLNYTYTYRPTYVCMRTIVHVPISLSLSLLSFFLHLLYMLFFLSGLLYF